MFWGCFVVLLFCFCPLGAWWVQSSLVLHTCSASPSTAYLRQLHLLQGQILYPADLFFLFFPCFRSRNHPPERGVKALVLGHTAVELACEDLAFRALFVISLSSIGDTFVCPTKVLFF